ncbi:MAG: hypothetical protein ACK52I_36000 [Pseudomonadota bacterium]|jgi:hypothetical protein
MSGRKRQHSPEQQQEMAQSKEKKQKTGEAEQQLQEPQQPSKESKDKEKVPQQEEISEAELENKVLAMAHNSGSTFCVPFLGDILNQGKTKFSGSVEVIAQEFNNNGPGRIHICDGTAICRLVIWEPEQKQVAFPISLTFHLLIF